MDMNGRSGAEPQPNCGKGIAAKRHKKHKKRHGIDWVGKDIGFRFSASRGGINIDFVTNNQMVRRRTQRGPMSTNYKVWTVSTGLLLAAFVDTAFTPGFASSGSSLTRRTASRHS